MKFKRQKKDHSFYIYGKNPVFEYIAHNPRDIFRIFVSDHVSANEFQEILNQTKGERIPVSRVSPKKMKDYVGDVSHQGIVALVKSFPYSDLDTFLEERDEWEDERPLVILLDKIQDTHNFGAIIRSAAAVGASAVIIAKDSQAPVNGTVFKTSAGTALLVPIIQVSNISHALMKLQKYGFWVAAVDMDEDNKHPLVYWEQNYTDSPMAFVFGAERKGVSDIVKKKSDYIVSIPMENGVESLNVSVSAALVMYEWKRQRMMDNSR